MPATTLPPPAPSREDPPESWKAPPVRPPWDERPTRIMTFTSEDVAAPPAVGAPARAIPQTPSNRWYAQRLLADQPDDVIDAVVEALEADQTQRDLDEDLWGAPTPRGTALAAAVQSARDTDAMRARLTDDALTVEQAATALGLSADEVRERLEQRRLIGIDGPDGTLLPRWQFTSSPDAPVIEGIRDVASEYPGGALGFSWWMLTPNESLGGATPRELLERGEVARVAGAARAIGG